MLPSSMVAVLRGAAASRLSIELPVNILASGTLCMFRKCLKRIFLLDISINSNCFEMTDIALEFLFSVIHVSIIVYVLD